MVFLISIGYILVCSRPFQNWAAQKAVNYLSKEFKTKVNLKSIDFELINTLVLEGLYVEDLHGDTLAYFGKLKTNFNYKIIFDAKLQLARISKVVLENTKINMFIHPNEKDYNYQFIVDYFASPKKSNKPFVPFKLYIKNLELRNVDFCMHNKNSKIAEGRKFDESFMQLKGINSHIKPFKLIGDSLYLGIVDMSFKEKSGFEVREFSANTIISSSMMEFSDLRLKTGYSKIGNYLKYTYDGYGKFSKFITDVTWEANLSRSVISMKDVSIFSDDLKSYSFPITISGGVKGTLAKMYGKKMDIKVGELNKFKGDVVLKDITDADKLTFNLNIFDLTANPSSIQDLTKTKLPEELLRIGSVKYTGTMAGGIKDFTTKGLIETTIGKIRTNINLKFPDGKPEEYKGEVELYAFNVGKLLNTNTLGNVSMITTMDGKGFSIENLNTELQSTIYNFYYDGYTYTNIRLDGLLEKKVFIGNFEIKDPNVNLSFNGMFDLNNENPTGDFHAKFGTVNLAKLGYGVINIKKIDEIDMTFEGKDIDNLIASAVLRNVIIERRDTVFYLQNINVEAYGLSSDRFVKVNSIIGNITLSGQFKASQFDAISDNFLYNLFPNYYPQLKSNAEQVNVRFDIDINNSKLLSALFLPSLTFEKFTATGIYNSATQNIDLVARSDYFKYDNFTFNDVNVESAKQPGQPLTVFTKMSGFYINDSLITDKLNLAASIERNDINFKINAADTTHDISIRTGGNIAFSKNTIDLNLIGSTVFLYNKPWVIKENSHFKYSENRIKIDSFNISNGNQSITINGLANEKIFDDLKVEINKFNLAEINPILIKWGVQLKGITNGKFTLNGTNTRPVIISEIDIQNLSYNGDSIGDVWLNTKPDNNPYSMIIDGHVKNGLINDLILAGNLDLTPGNDKIDLVLTLTKSNIKPFEIFTTGIFSNIVGVADAEIKVKGRLSNPDIVGSIDIYNASLFMDYLGLPLKMEKIDIEIDEKKIDLGTFAVYDKYGARATGGGKIYHKNFTDLRFDIFMKDLKNFNCLDLTEDKADMFFGKAYVDGNMTISGSLNELYLKINAKTRPKTVISLPLSGTSENAGPDFIKLVDLRADIIEPPKNLSGITMDFNFNITEDALIQLIFDSKFNDVIEANGEGNIEMKLNTFGDFYMYGNYTILNGNYNFTTLSNFVNKDLKVKRGSNIKWNGNPLDALIDIKAITTITADARVILPQSASTTSSSKMVGVDCEIYMKEKLFTPQIRLGIALSEQNQSSFFADAELNNAMNQIKNDPEETNKQFVSLLLLNSFVPINNSGALAAQTNYTSSFQNSLGSLMASQVNNWLRQIDPNLELGVDWQTANTAETNKQIIVSLKKKLLNDRLEVGVSGSGNLSYDVNVSFKIKKDGSLLLRQFNRRANDPLNVNSQPVNTNGLGLYYRREIDYFFPKWQKRIHNKKQKKKLSKQH